MILRSDRPGRRCGGAVLCSDGGAARTPRRRARAQSRASAARFSSRAAGGAISPTSTAGPSTSSPPIRNSHDRRWRATRRRISSRWSSATASPITRRRWDSCSATARRRQIVDLLLAECRDGGVDRRRRLRHVSEVRDGLHRRHVARALRGAVADRGHRRPLDPEDRRDGSRLSASPQQFDVPIVPPRPALVPLVFDDPTIARAGATWRALRPIARDSADRARRLRSASGCCSHIAA